MGGNLKLRGRTWYARVGVNPTHWDRVGKREFVRSLQTTDKRIAERRKHKVISEIRAEIDDIVRASNGEDIVHSSDPAWLISAAHGLKRAYDSGEMDSDTAHEILSTMREKHYEAAGIAGNDVKPYAVAAHKIVDGEDYSYLSLSKAIKDYLKTQESKIKKSTYNYKASRLQAFCKWAGGDTALETVTRKTANRYLKETLENNGESPANNRKVLNGALGPFFTDAIRRGLYEQDNPFANQIFRFPDTDKSDRSYRAWTDDELIKLFAALKDVPKGATLGKGYDVAHIALYTGARLNEICALKIQDVNLTEGFLAVDKGKTENSIRQIPIHSALVPTLERLVHGREKGYLIEGLKSGGEDSKRSHSLGNRFSELKRELFPNAGRTLAFHGLRSTFLTALEDAQVPTSTAELIVGHARQSLSYGLYSKGPKLPILAEGVEKLKFPV